jgi:hypothetical protein
VIGVGQYARRICPHVSPAKIHSFHLDAAAIYEIMASSANKDNFVILNNMWAPVTTVNWAVDDKATTFAAFLNLGRIFKICEERKMEFKYHVTVLMTQLIYWVSCCHPKSQNHLSLQKDGSFEKTFILRRNINQRPLSSKQLSAWMHILNASINSYENAMLKKGNWMIILAAWLRNHRRISDDCRSNDIIR